MNRRRRLAVLLAGLIAAGGLTVLPDANAAELTNTSVPVRQWGCIWLDALDISVCLSG